MNPVYFALAWLYARRLVPQAVAAVLAMVFLPYLAFITSLGADTNAFESYRFHLPFLGLLFTFIGALALQQHETLAPDLFLKPLGNRLLFAALILVPISILLVAVLAGTFLINSVYSATWPFLRPSCYLAALGSAASAIFYLTLRGRYLMALAMFTTMVSCLVLCGRPGYFPDGIHRPLVLNAPLHPIELIVLPLGTAASLTIAYQSLSALRTRGGIKPSSAGTWPVQPSPASVPEFLSAESAMAWYHQRQLRPVIAAGLAIACLAAAAQGMAYFQDQQGLELAGLFSMLQGIGIASLMGLVMGGNARFPSHPASRPTRQSMTSFLATKPLSDRQLWHCLARSFWSCTLRCTAVVAIVGILLPNLLLRVTQGVSMEMPPALLRLAEQCGGLGVAVILWTAFTMLLIFGGATLFASTVLIGRDRLIRNVVATAYAIFAAGLFALAWTERVFSSEFARVTGNVLWSFLAILLAALSVVCFRQAYLRRLLTGIEILTALGVWGLSCLGLKVAVPPSSPFFMVIDAAILLLLILGFAAGPLCLIAARRR